MQYTLVKNEEGESNLTVYVEGQKPLTAHSSHPQFDKLVAGVVSEDESVYQLFDIALTAGQKFERLSERVTVANGRLYFDGEEVNNSLGNQVIRFIEEGEDFAPLVNFFENVMQNPNEHSRENLYAWLEAQKISITPSGLLVGYKGVKKDDKGNLVSCTAGTAISDGVLTTGNIPNPVGAVVEMPRTEVMHNPRNDCDAGLHVGSFTYAKGYGSVLLEVHVNPRDVVSVPDAGWKLRTCRYTVVKVLKDEYTKVLVKDAKPKSAKGGFTKPVKKQTEGPVRRNDVYEDADKRRVGRLLKVTVAGGASASVKDIGSGKTSVIANERLLNPTRYKRVKRGKKS